MANGGKECGAISEGGLVAVEADQLRARVAELERENAALASALGGMRADRDEKQRLALAAIHLCKDLEAALDRSHALAEKATALAAQTKAGAT
jgi:hypothetical protein